MGARVLIVDGDERVRTVVARQLEAGGFSVVHAVDGESALAEIAAARPDIVIPRPFDARCRWARRAAPAPVGRG